MNNTSNQKSAIEETHLQQRSVKPSGFTKLTLDFRGTWLPVLILSVTIIASMLIVAGFTYTEKGAEKHHPHQRAAELLKTDEVNVDERKTDANTGTPVTATPLKQRNDDDEEEDDDDDYYYHIKDKNHRRNHIIQLVVTFFSVCVGLFCVYFECGNSLELWLLAVPWAIWLVFGAFTLSGGFDVPETVSMIANSVAVTAILTTYSYSVKSSKKLIFALIVLSTASLFFFPHFGSNAFSIPISIMATHVATFCATFAIIGYFDALMGEKIFSRGDIGHQIIRMLRVGWVLFVETRLLFFLVPQILIIILNLNYLMNSDATIAGNQMQITVMDMEVICKSAANQQQQQNENGGVFSLFH